MNHNAARRDSVSKLLNYSMEYAEMREKVIRQGSTYPRCIGPKTEVFEVHRKQRRNHALQRAGTKNEEKLNSKATKLIAGNKSSLPVNSRTLAHFVGTHCKPTFSLRSLRGIGATIWQWSGKEDDNRQTSDGVKGDIRGFPSLFSFAYLHDRIS